MDATKASVSAGDAICHIGEQGVLQKCASVPMVNPCTSNRIVHSTDTNIVIRLLDRAESFASDSKD